MTDHRSLTNGQYRVVITAAGAGASLLNDVELTRWSSDSTREPEGSFLYVRDLESGDVWSAGHQPVQARPSWYRATCGPDLMRIVRHDHEVEVRSEITVLPDLNVECRRYTIHNLGEHPRQLEVTTCIEVVLNVVGAEAGHPAFSKLFVQTEWDAAAAALVARRRPRSPDDPILFMAHSLRMPKDGAAAALEWESDRARFIGRGRMLAHPAALLSTDTLSGTVGNVLDPLFALRGKIELAPGATVVVDSLMSAGGGRDEVLQLLAAATSHMIEERIGCADAASYCELRSADATAPTGVPVGGIDAVLPPHADLLFPNSYGGFTADGTEYLIQIARSVSGPELPPLPWTNVLANSTAGTVVSEAGLGFTWAGNSRENRLTPWFNDPVSDPVGEALYLRDEATREYWSPTPAPVCGASAYEVRHGFGYTTWRHTSLELHQSVECFVAADAPVKVVRLRVTNEGATPRRLTVAYFAEWVLGGARATSAPTVVTESALQGSVILATNPGSRDFGSAVAFAAIVGPGTAGCEFTADRAGFLGAYGSATSPAALGSADPLDGRAGAGLDPCAAFRAAADLAPGETVEWIVLIGQTGTREAALQLVARFGEPDAVDTELLRVQASWHTLLQAVHVETPVPALDLMLNGWAMYQNLSCRIWARSAMYQSGGAFGFRDQLQDAASLVFHAPHLTRSQILLHAANQFVEGDVMHWWHPPVGRGIRTHFADDLLWLPMLTQYYVDITGDAAVYDESARYLTARALEPGEDEAFLAPTDSGTHGSVYDHCCRALDRSLRGGAHDLPLMGTGDWNDGMNRVGREGRGESVWMGFFLYYILERFLPTCVARGDHKRAARYRERMRSLHGAVNAGGWDGAWYRRAYYDDGTPLGSASGDECRIDALAQAWAVIAGVASVERANQALDAMELRLVDESAGIIRLLDPPFDVTPHDPGYIKGYLPGVRENGGQYTHAALWAVRALAEAGRNERAARLLEMVSPVTRGGSAAAIATYQVEPYVIAADVYGELPHTGRGGWTWYTGSAGWLFRVGFESILGITLVAGHTMVLRPCLPADWPGFTLRYRLPGSSSTLHLVVRQHDGPTAIRSATIRATVVDGAVHLALPRDTALHQVEVDLGPDVGTDYRPSTPPSD